MMEHLIHSLRFQLERFFDQRKIRQGILGLPVLLALLLMLAMPLISRLETGPARLERLESEAQGHLESGRLAEARVAALRLAQEASMRQKAAVLEAKALRGMGKQQEALRLLTRYAPLDPPGYAPAHVQQAVLLLAQKTPDVPAAHKHIENALISDPANADALELSARFAASRRDWRSTLEVLERLSLVGRPDLLLMKATALQFSGQEPESIQCAGVAEQTLCAMPLTAGAGADRVRLSIAVSLSLQRKFEQAVMWLHETASVTPGKEERQVLGGIYLSWSQHIKKQPSIGQPSVLELLERGLQISPESQDIIMAFLQECDELPVTSEERSQHVERALKGGGIATSFMHYYLGLQEWKHGSKQGARSHFELASTLNPGFAIISNNLAMAIAAVSDQKDELDKALLIMDELIKAQPENPFFLDTRGHVLGKMGRLEESARDLERSLTNARDKSRTHAKLAELYQRLKMPELAARHQSMSQAGHETLGGSQ